MKKIFALIIVMVFGVCSSVHAFPLAGLVGEWTFDGNANDTSGNGNHGTVFGATLTTDRFGNTNSAYSFDGSNDFIKASATNLPSANRTVSLWFNADTVANGRSLLCYGGGGGGPPGTSWLEILNVGTSPGTFHMQSHFGSNAIDFFYGSEPLNDWFHWVLTTEVSGTKMYINGVEVASNSTYVSNTIVAGTDLSIGVAVFTDGTAPFTDVNATYFDGTLDDVRIYDRALSPSEIQELFHPVPEPATIALLGIGLAGLAGVTLRRRLKKTKQ